MLLGKYIVTGDEIVLATHNLGKVDEFKVLLSGYKFKILTSADLDIGDIDETGSSFEENSILKVKTIPSNYYAIADDSGLCIRNLNDNPGILSARYAKSCGGWYEAMKELYYENHKKNSDNFEAKFCCSLSIKFPDGKIFSYSGDVSGEITWPPRGGNGFGYDPFFIPSGENVTYGEMNYSKKIQTDHRSIAFRKLSKAHLKSN